MSGRSSCAALLVALWVVACAGHEAPLRAGRTRYALDCADGSAIYWGPERVGESPSGGACAELLVTSAGVFVAEQARAAADQLSITLLGDSAPALRLVGVRSVSFAANPRRRELVITGRYERRLPSLPADAPESGYFVLAADPKALPLWSVSLPAADIPEDATIAALLTEDGSVVLSGRDSLLRRLPAVGALAAGADTNGWAMARVARGTVSRFASFVGEPLAELSGAGPNALYSAEQAGDARVLRRLSPSFAPLWEKSLASFALQSLVASPSGVWLATAEYVPHPSRPHLDAKVANYGLDGAVHRGFAFGDDSGAPVGHQRVSRLALAADGKTVWALGSFESSVAIGACRSRTDEFGPHSFLAAVSVDAKPLLLAQLGAQATELSPQLAVGEEQALIARDDGTGRCELGRVSLVDQEPR